MHEAEEDDVTAAIHGRSAELRDYMADVSTIANDRTLLHIQTGPLPIHHPALELCLTCASDPAAFLAGGTIQAAEERATPTRPADAPR
jgi:hypothetical protein